ncbi:hypothetical protein H9660_05170 [Clostridium sp. Sa3CUN1]|uniref:Uncharacterized protein n=1 Tax=Clostridium gallinarum TaxID=2762246 RepID=A0ABR8Q2G8_9CLOT|nr:hypothetical protein [Clostridium gallinarum]MBD7914529.1 hypothetical protein [Clostridium gallinarum]
MPKGTNISLPCDIGDIVYTIYCDDCPCDLCEYGMEADFNPIKCSQLSNEYECPTPHYSIEKHICEGFEISKGEYGEIIISNPGEWGPEGLEQFYGYDNKVYYSYEDAENELRRIREK